jgi:hypothetical protein
MYTAYFWRTLYSCMYKITQLYNIQYTAIIQLYNYYTGW